MVEPVSERGVVRLEDQKTTKSVTVLSREKVSVLHWFTEEELSRFFGVIPADARRETVFFVVLLGTGKRVSEVLAMRRRDLDFVGRTWKLVTLKKRLKREDVIRLHPDVAYWLSVFAGGCRADDLVFGFSRQYADSLVKKYCGLAGISSCKAHCHTFRHTFAVRWLEQGKPLHKLQRHLGHGHISTTMMYLRVVDSDYNETVDSLDMLGFMRGGKEK